MRILIAQANAAAKGGAEDYADSLRRVLVDDGHAVGTIDISGHTPSGTRPTPRSILFPNCALWNWAQVCRVLPKAAQSYDRVVLAYGEGPKLPIPSLTLRHSPTLFSTNTALLGCIGARPTMARLSYIRICARLAGPRAQQHETTTITNTAWTADMIARHTDFHADGVLYPKVAKQSPTVAARRPFRILILGRIVPNKRIEMAIEICDALRSQGFPIEVEVLGRADCRYARRLLARLAGRAHVLLSPDADTATRARALSQARFGLHMFQGEHFGIAVAEMILHGVAPLVYDDGGVCELVGDTRLRFRDHHAATAKLAALCMRPDLVNELVRGMLQGPALRNALNFDVNARDLTRDWLASERGCHAAQ